MEAMRAGGSEMSSAHRKEMWLGSVAVCTARCNRTQQSKNGMSCSRAPTQWLGREEMAPDIGQRNMGPLYSVQYCNGIIQYSTIVSARQKDRMVLTVRYDAGNEQQREPSTAKVIQSTVVL